MVSKHLFVHPQWFTCPFLRLFGIFRGPKRATTGSKRPINTCFSIPSGLGTTLEKMIFFAPATLADPALAPTVRGPACPPAPPSDHWYGGLGGSLGDSEAWKPQKVGSCGWTRCLRNSDLSHVPGNFRPVLGFGLWVRIAQVFGDFWRLFGPFLGHIVELKGTRELFDTSKSSRTCSVDTVSLRLVVSPGFWGCFGRKMAVFGPKVRRLGRAPPNLAPPPRAATGEFVAKHLDLARPLPRLQDG